MEQISSDYEFMCGLEKKYREVSGIVDSEFYKIFYSRVHQTDILVLGINPGGKPLVPETIIDLNKGQSYDERIREYCEDGRHDILDYSWKENFGLLNLLIPVFTSKSELGERVVKTNMAFRRSGNAKDKAFIAKATLEAIPFLTQIIARVSPKIVLLTGVDLFDFTKHYCIHNKEIYPREIDKRVNQTIFWVSQATFHTGKEALIVSTAHASQFGWIYAQNKVPDRIKSLLSQSRGTVDLQKRELP